MPPKRSPRPVPSPVSRGSQCRVDCLARIAAASQEGASTFPVPGYDGVPETLPREAFYAIVSVRSGLAPLGRACDWKEVLSKFCVSKACHGNRSAMMWDEFLQTAANL